MNDATAAMYQRLLEEPATLGRVWAAERFPSDEPADVEVASALRGWATGDETDDLGFRDSDLIDWRQIAVELRADLATIE